MRTVLICLTLAAFIVLSGCSSPSHPQQEAAAVAAATSWLTLVDGEQYAASWDGAAEHFKANIPKDKWLQAMNGGRKSYGKNLSRELKFKRFRTALPGAPDGEYVVIQFNSSFEHKKKTLETITPMLDKDGQWRVSGYFMK